jgi:hypothetical protein
MRIFAAMVDGRTMDNCGMIKSDKNNNFAIEI